MTTCLHGRIQRLLLSALSAASVLVISLIGAEHAHAAPCNPTITTTSGSTRVAFNTVGTCDWTVPAGIYSVDVLIVAGGGGGGGGGASTAGSGGGGGQVQVLSSKSVTPGQILSVVVGAGGSAGALGGGTGGTGGTSSISIAGTSASSGGVGGVTNSFTLGGAPKGGSSGNANTGGNASTTNGYSNGGGGGGSGGASTSRNGGSGTTWNGVVFGGGGGGGSFYGSPTTAANAQGYGAPYAGGGGYISSTDGQLCSYGGTATYGGGGGGAVRDYGGVPCAGSAGGSGTVKLVYPVAKTVVFDKNAADATGTMSNQQSNIARALTSNTFARVGYTFAGWATTPGGSVAYADGASFPFTATTTTLYAVWAGITYNGNGTGVTGSVANTTGTPGTSVNLAANGFTPPNSGAVTYTFLGWDTNPNATTPTYTLPASVTMPSGVLSLYAIWDPQINASVTYNSNGGGGSETTQTGTVGSPITLATGSGMTFPGYTLSSWNTAGNGSGTSYSLGSTITLPNGGLALYAIWTPLPVITYDGNGGSGSVSSQTAAAGSTVALSANGFSGGVNTFLGWDTNPNATTPTYVLPASVVMPSGGLDLYAIWNPPIVRTITYAANGGTGSEASQTDVAGDPVTLATGGGMTYSGRELLGWDTNANATTPTYARGESTTMPVNGLALYAIWSAPATPPVPLWTLSYNANEGSCSRTSEQAYDTAWLTLPDSSVCSRDGYIFTGWNTAPDGSGLGFMPGGATQMTGDNTLYAQWRKVQLPLKPPAPSPTSSPTATPTPTPTPTATPTPTPTPAPSAAPTPTPDGTPGSDGLGPIPAPSPLPTSDGVSLQPKKGTITQPDGGSVNATEGGSPSSGASFTGGSISIWDGTKWTQSYNDPGVGTWLVVNGDVQFVPVPGFVGTARTTMRVVDSNGKVGYAPVEFTVLPSPKPAPPALPERGSGGLGPIPAPPALPADESGVVVPPKSSPLDGPSGTIDPLDGATPSAGATLDPGSVVVWDGASWVTSYDDPGVGTWSVVNGKVVFTPLPSFCGTASTSVKVTDTLGRSGIAPVAFTKPCSKPGSDGTGFVPGPPPPPAADIAGDSPASAASLSGLANADGGVINAAIALADFDPTPSTLRIWDGTAWVRKFTDPGVGTWSVVNGRILFTPAKGFTGVARSTFRIRAGNGSTVQGPVAFTVPRTCSIPTASALAIGFATNDTTVGKDARQSLARFLSPRCEYVVTGFVQPAGPTSNDRSLSLGRAQAVADLIKQRNPGAAVRVIIGGRWLQDSCKEDENRCAVLRTSRAAMD